MNLTEVTTRCKDKPQIRFRVKGTLVDLEFKPSGRIGYVTGQSYEVGAKELLEEYELVCSHPFDRVVNKGDKMIDGGICRDCSADISYGVRKDFPKVPEPIKQALDKIEADARDSLLNPPKPDVSPIVEKLKQAEPTKPAKKSEGSGAKKKRLFG